MPMPKPRDTLDWRRLLDEALTAPGDLTGVYDRFHDYSFANMLLFRQQGIHEPVASFSRWKALGRHILKGAKAKEVIVPVVMQEALPLENEAEATPTAEHREAVARVIGFKAVRAIFALSDTDGPELPAVKPADWDLQAALGKLGVREVPFDELNGNIHGYSQGLEFAINPLAVNRTKTVFHELGHIVLGHTLPSTIEEYRAHRGIAEFQAEAVAYLSMNELDLLDEQTASVSRGYFQHWLKDEQLPDRTIQQVFRATDAILKAGRVA